jgi:hypothetical protein
VQIRNALRRLAAWLCVALIAGAALSAFADEATERRMQAGARLFRALLAADVDLPKKTTGGNQLLIIFYADGNARQAGELAASFAAADLRGLAVVAEATNDASLARYVTRVPAGIFIASATPRPVLQSLIRYGIEHHVIVYSPFEGDVELGVLGGLAIEAQVRPFVNRATLEASRITLKSFFLQVAKVYR